MPGLRPPEISDSTSAAATAANSSGTQIPSLSPLSTLSPWRILCGTRGSVTTAWPSAASVGARTIARITASSTLSSPNRTAAATAPRMMVSGSPMPSSRTGTSAARRSWARSMREASQKSTSARVASARVRTVEPVLERSTPSSTSGPTSNPKATNSIAGVIGVPASRRETAATPSRASATSASDHSIHDPLPVRDDAGTRDARVGRRSRVRSSPPPLMPRQSSELPGWSVPVSRSGSAIRSGSRSYVHGRPDISQPFLRRMPLKTLSASSTRPPSIPSRML